MLFVVIGFTPQNRQSAIELLHKQKTDHLMAEGHLAERDLGIRTVIDSRAETICSSDDERQAARRGVQPRLQLLGKRHAAVFDAMLIEQHNETLPYGTKDKFTFLLILLLPTQVLGVLQVRDNLNIERDIMLEALRVRLNHLRQFAAYCLANYQEGCFHTICVVYVVLALYAE